MLTIIRKSTTFRPARGLLVALAAALALTGLAAPAWASARPGTDTGTLQNVTSLVSDSDSGATCALLSTGHVTCWGDNGDGELGNGTETSSDVPVPVHGITDAKAIAEDNQDGSNGGSFCALLSTGHIDCWGNNNDGQLGNGNTTTFTLPVAVKNISTAATIIGGNYSFCARLASSHADCWGYNGNGELGNGSTTNSDVPVAVENIGNAAALASDADSGSSCALLATSHLACWGYNNDGQLGNGTTTSSDKPVAVVGISNAKKITEDSNGGSGGGSFCALLSTSHLKCWGYNSDGELGNGNTTDFTLPVAVKNISTAATIIGGDYGFCALLSSSHLDCWGYGSDGQLGNGNTTSQDVPVAVRKITNAAQVIMGNYGYCALLSTTHVDCWGYGGHGEMGNGNTLNEDVPVAVLAVG